MKTISAEFFDGPLDGLITEIKRCDIFIHTVTVSDLVKKNRRNRTHYYGIIGCVECVTEYRWTGAEDE